MKSVQGDFGPSKAFCNTQALKHSSLVEGVKGAGLCFVRHYSVRPVVRCLWGQWGCFYPSVAVPSCLSLLKALKGFARVLYKKQQCKDLIQ